MLTHTHTASSSHATPTSNELDRVKKPAYFDSARRNRHLLVKNNWFGGITVIIINRFGPRPPSRKRQRMSAVKTPIIADNNQCWMTDGRTGENVKLNQGGRQLRQVRKEDNVGNVALLLDLVVAPRVVSQQFTKGNWRSRRRDAARRRRPRPGSCIGDESRKSQHI